MATAPSSSTRGDRTRAAILEAAARHLAEVGLEGLRAPQVAGEAGVSEATVWFHFGTKAGLLVAVMEAYYDRLVTDLAEVVDRATTPRDRLAAFAHAWLHRIAGDLALVGELGRHGRHAPHDEVGTAFAACNRRVTRLFERLVEDLVATGTLRPDVSPRLVRDAFFGTSEHLLVGRHVTGRRDDLDELADELLRLLLDGAAVAAAPEPEAPDPLVAMDRKLDRLLGLLAPD